ncbi:MAG: hypothetical protein JOY99_00815 [Sphingomonadaceae bacterium]|nr:hypothetical protein [Sphingomonadaceae bacterium]
MNKLLIAAMSATSLLFGGAALAQDAAAFPLHAGVTIRSSDGHRLGFVDQVFTGSDGQPTAAQVIVDDRLVNIPVSTIKPVDKTHFTTSLSYKEVEHL